MGGKCSSNLVPVAQLIKGLIPPSAFGRDRSRDLSEVVGHGGGLKVTQATHIVDGPVLAVKSKCRKARGWLFPLSLSDAA